MLRVYGSKAMTTAHERSSYVEPHPAPRRLLLPKEHGAYAQLVFPMITAVAIGQPSGAQFFWITAATAVFLAHEPLLILAGERGQRSRARLAIHARFRAALLLVLAIAAGLLGWWLAPRAARLAVVAPLALATILVPLILTHREKTLYGELLASFTFSTLAIPVALAGGASAGAALIASGVWCSVFSLSTLTVRATISRVKKAAGGGRACCVNLLLSIAATLVAIFSAASGIIPVLAAAALIPVALITSAFSIVEVHTRHLRTMGWSLVGTSIITLIALVAGLR
jgi:hypothetical protein